jgi:hypothetical protein
VQPTREPEAHGSMGFAPLGAASRGQMYARNASAVSMCMQLDVLHTQLAHTCAPLHNH